MINWEDDAWINITNVYMYRNYSIDDFKIYHFAYSVFFSPLFSFFYSFFFLFSIYFFNDSLAWASYLPYLYYFAASRFIALCTSGVKSILCRDWTISTTFLFGCHYFYPTIYLQISPSFTLGCQIIVLNFIIGNLNGNCSGKSKSTIRSLP